MTQTFKFKQEEVLKLMIDAIGEKNPHLAGKAATARFEYSAKTNWKAEFTVDVG